ncbi:MAG TPA: winged helix DNA-binding domain-containing protein [Myxococcaceae bacterium]|jgi:hypothetical protein
MADKLLTRRALSRATLARQMLLAREKTPVLRAIERLVGLQAQLARPPYIGLWSRVEGFQREALTQLVLSRKAVRATAMRGTLHLMSAKDFVALRPALQPMLTKAMHANVGERIQGLELEQMLATARTYLEQEPRTFNALRPLLVKAHPKGDERAMGFAVRTQLPLVQVPTDTKWGYPGTADFTVAETWLGEPMGTDATPHALVLRFLAAFGPASVGDAQTWSGLGGLREVFEALRPGLSTFRDERGRELFDLPKAPRPDEDTAAPVRFLPDYDNLLLAHEDRTRVIADEHRRALTPSKNLRVLPSFLVDGFVAGTWEVERKKGVAALVLQPFSALSKQVREALAEEGDTLVRFVESDASTFEVRLPARAARPRAPATR